jgi:hypothetical protein
MGHVCFDIIEDKSLNGKKLENHDSSRKKKKNSRIHDSRIAIRLRIAQLGM